MYSSLKKIAFLFIPRDWIIKNEHLIRKTLFFLYRGSKKGCNICEKTFTHFIKLETGDIKCPYCGSIDRNRRLWQLLTDDFLKRNQSILHFSPSRPVYKKLKKTHFSYVSTDYEGEFLADKKLDITAIDEKNESYDLIICYHVLEHIQSDYLALSELYRVLKQGGKCLVQTPFKEGETYENDKISTKEERLKHFGQEDHVRIYSVADLTKRAEKVGFNVEVRLFNESPKNFHGFKQHEHVLVFNKPFPNQ